MVSDGAIAFRLEVLHGIQIRNVNASPIWGWAFLTILVNVHSKEQSIDTMNLLEQSNALRANRVLSGAATTTIPLMHLGYSVQSTELGQSQKDQKQNGQLVTYLFPNKMFLFGIRHDTDRKMLSPVNLAY